jgi:hypothetical protein
MRGVSQHEALSRFGESGIKETLIYFPLSRGERGWGEGN